jgi:tetratricopeptide (TPR) repeat protein
LLLDRKKIRRWAKWVALGLAIVFVASFLFLGVGYGGAGFDLSRIFSGGCSEKTGVTDTANTKLDEYLATLEENPKDTDTMLAVATLYEDMYDPDAGEGTQYLDKAAEYLEQAISVAPSLKELYLRLARLYIKSGDANQEAATAAETAGDTLTQGVYGQAAHTAYKDAARVLNRATSVDPDNPEVYLYLGIAQRSAGEDGAAILAWQKYLQLDPTGDQAGAIAAALEQLTAPSTTTTAGLTTTTGGSTTTTAGSTTTTGAATTTTTD